MAEVGVGKAFFPVLGPPPAAPIIVPLSVARCPRRGSRVADETGNRVSPSFGDRSLYCPRNGKREGAQAATAEHERSAGRRVPGVKREGTRAFRHSPSPETGL